MEEKGLNIKPVQYHTMGENIVQNLRDSIIVGRLNPGVRITETELAETMGVSRNVVREALLILANDGLIEKERNRYSKVVKYTKKDVEDIFQLRTALETTAVKTCVESQALCSELLEYSQKIDRILDRKNSDYSDLIYADIGLHTHIVEVTNNKWLIDTWRRIVGPVMLLLFQHMNDVQAMNSRHAGLIEVFQKGDYRKASDALEEHIQNTLDVLLKNYE